MNILIVCETSGVVRRALRAAGHDAWSCDLLECEDKSPHHLVCDARKAMAAVNWHAFGIHPPCQYLSVAGMHWNKRGRGTQGTKDALRFVRELMALAGERPYYLENPVGVISTKIRKPDQIIQPYEFGEDASKKTCLWLHGLPPLTGVRPWSVAPRFVCSTCGAVHTAEASAAWRDGRGERRCNRCRKTGRLLPRWANQTDSGQNRLPPSETRWKDRSRTYPGIAAAMAAQWFKQ